jgi:hypothetical protein
MNKSVNNDKAWGPSVWALFHTLAEQINEDKYITVATELVGFIRRICSLLPCPDCQDHSYKYWITTKYNLTSKQGLKDFLFLFHNAVNQKKSKKVEDKDILNIYKTNNLAVVYNNFITSFTSRGITRLLGDSLHRKRLIDEFRPWLLKNAELFRQS